MPTLLRGLSILLVEDDDDLRELLRHVLSEHGADVTGARTIAEARDALQTRAHDVMVTDLGLPDGHGHVLGGEALAVGVGAAIALTGDRNDATLDASSASGFRLHLGKPFDPQLLAHVVASLGLNDAT